MARDSDYFFHRVLRNNSLLPQRISRTGEEFPLTLLLIALERDSLIRQEDLLGIDHHKFGRSRGGLPAFRLRIWDRDYLSTLIYRYPQLGYKYFSDEARSLAKYRKGPDALYKENVALTERLGRTVAELESERGLRIRAERDAVWKDISFSAAHKIGNPIFAIETDLDPLLRRIRSDRPADALPVVDNIRSAIERAKSFVERPALKSWKWS